jgi:hypothetical protein
MEQQLEQLSKACSIAEASALGLLKSHVSEYTRQDGTVVQAHDDSRQKRDMSHIHNFDNVKMIHHKPTGRSAANDKWTQHEAKAKDISEGNSSHGDVVNTGSLVHHADRKTKGQMPAIAYHKNHVVTGSEKAVWEAHKLADKLTGGKYNTTEEDRNKISEHVKKKTGEDVKFHERLRGNWDKLQDFYRQKHSGHDQIDQIQNHHKKAMERKGYADEFDRSSVHTDLAKQHREAQHNHEETRDRLIAESKNS